MAGSPLLAAGSRAAFAAKAALIERLIQEARALPHVSQRIDFISGKLLGVRYQADTLIGGPKHPERFVVRDDAFDCVTFCEVVLAAAIARDLAEFETSLRRIRYDHGNVQYDQRNHYFADWCKRNIENGICQPVAIEPSVVIDKTVTWHREFGRHPVSIVAISKETLLRQRQAAGGGRHHRLHVAARGSRLLSHRPRRVRQERRAAAAQCIAKPRPRRGRQDDGVRHRQSGELS